MGWPERSALQHVARDGAGGDARWWLWWQLELELLDQEPEFWLRLSVAGQQQLAPVGCRQMNIDHLDGKPTSSLIIDESSFPKQGDRSVGVARQWSGRLGKVDNCQQAVFGVLTDGQRHVPVDMRLYLPKGWIDDPARCDQAGIPETARKLTTKSEHALDIVRQARVRGMRFEWVGIDGGYGKEPAFLRALDDANETFVADVHRTQRVWTDLPGLHVPQPRPGRGRPANKRQASAASVTVEALVATAGFTSPQVRPTRARHYAKTISTPERTVRRLCADSRRRQHGRWRKQKGLKLDVVDPIRQRPTQPRPASARYVAVDRSLAQPQALCHRPLGQPLTQPQPQHLTYLPHRQSLAWHLVPLLLGKGPKLPTVEDCQRPTTTPPRRTRS